MSVNPGDKVTWRHVPRGGYGYIFYVPATVVNATARRVIIDAQLKRGGTKRVSVRRENLLP